MKQRFIDVRVLDVLTNEPISGLTIDEATVQQLNAVLQLAPANSIIEISVREREVSIPPVK